MIKADKGRKVRTQSFMNMVECLIVFIRWLLRCYSFFCLCFYRPVSYPNRLGFLRLALFQLVRANQDKLNLHTAGYLILYDSAFSFIPCSASIHITWASHNIYDLNCAMRSVFLSSMLKFLVLLTTSVCNIPPHYAEVCGLICSMLIDANK